jgi:hypothetical protein
MVNRAALSHVDAVVRHTNTCVRGRASPATPHACSERWDAALGQGMQTRRLHVLTTQAASNSNHCATAHSTNMRCSTGEQMKQARSFHTYVDSPASPTKPLRPAVTMAAATSQREVKLSRSTSPPAPQRVSDRQLLSRDSRHNCVIWSRD